MESRGVFYQYITANVEFYMLLCIVSLTYLFSHGSQL